MVRVASGKGYESFAGFVALRHSALLRSARFISGDPHLAQDLVQDALVKLALHWDRVGNGSPEAYVRTIMYRDYLSWRRRRRREAALEDIDRASPEVTESVDDRLALQSALMTLSAKQRAIVVLRFYEDLSVEQTAAVLGVSAGTVKSQCHAAIQNLRDQQVLFTAHEREVGRHD